MNKATRLFNIAIAFAGIISLSLLMTSLTQAQSRPRRVKGQTSNTDSQNTTKKTEPKEEPLIDVIPTNKGNTSTTTPSATSNKTNTTNNSSTATSPTTNTTRPKTQPTTATTTNTANTTPNSTPQQTTSPTDTTNAYNLLQQKKYDEALKEAKRIIGLDANNAEALKIAGFAEYYLKQYADAAKDLQKSLDIRRAAKEKDDEKTIDALALAYARSEQFDKALPLLVQITSKADAKPDSGLLYLRGLAELRGGKPADAEKSFNAAVKADPKNSQALYLLGQIAFERNDFSAAIAAFQRTTQADPKMAAAWERLTLSYLQRAAITMEEDETKAKADYAGAISAAEGLTRAMPGDDSTALLGQALVSAGNYNRATLELEKITVGPKAKGETLYLLGVSYSRLKNFPKAISALERAAQKKADDANIYRELGYAAEVSKQYAKALNAYEKGAKLAPDDSYFTEGVNRVKPFAKKP
jgi:tetratricopeptide (TPR) repeat protein